MAYAFRYIVHVYFGKKRDDYPKTPHDPGIGLWGPPAVLVALVVAIGLFPAVVAGPLVEQVSRAVIGGDTPYYSLSLWHGVTPALFMSIAAIGLGLVILSAHRQIAAFWHGLTLPDAKVLFDRVVVGATRAAVAFTARLQNGSLERYIAMFIGAAVVCLLYTSPSPRD